MSNNDDIGLRVMRKSAGTEMRKSAGTESHRDLGNGSQTSVSPLFLKGRAEVCILSL